jgi:hypothetical protein
MRPRVVHWFDADVQVTVASGGGDVLDGADEGAPVAAPPMRFVYLEVDDLGHVLHVVGIRPRRRSAHDETRGPNHS